MLATAWILAAVAASLLAAPYVGVPLLTRALALRPFRRKGHGAAPKVAILIPALDEAEALPAKLADCLAQDWPADRLEIWVGSDGSTDGTEAVAAGFAGVQVVVHPERQGKASMVNTLLQVTDAELVLLTDATARLPRHAVQRLVAAFEDPAVAVASAAYGVADPEDGEAHYWARETARHAAAAARDLLLGAHGAAYGHAAGAGGPVRPLAESPPAPAAAPEPSPAQPAAADGGVAAAGGPAPAAPSPSAAPASAPHVPKGCSTASDAPGAGWLGLALALFGIGRRRRPGLVRNGTRPSRRGTDPA